MPDQPIPLGKVVSALRTQRGMSLEETARQAGISKGYLHSIESNETKAPSVYVIARIAAIFGVAIEDVINAHSEPAIVCPVCRGRGWCKPEDLRHVRIEQEGDE